MRRIFRALSWLVLALSIVVVALAGYVRRTWDRTWDAPTPDIHASTDPDVIERGEYLVFGPAHCVECHTASVETFERYVATKERPPLAGGMPFAVPPLVTLYPKNLTPDPETGIGRYSDGQIARLLRYSVRADGHASVQPLMPYGSMSDDDLTAIISFLRAQPPVRRHVPDAEWTLTGKVVRSLSPVFEPRTGVQAPKTSPAEQPTLERGEYLARSVGNCEGCHSPRSQVTFQLSGPEFSGGAPMEPRPLPGVDRTMWYQPPNLTPRVGSAIRRFPDRETFVARFQRGGRKHEASPMAWDSFGKMTTEDAGALFEYFMSLPAAGAASPDDPTVRQ
jgi:mono/diheme cytochrome c family protein